MVLFLYIQIQYLLVLRDLPAGEVLLVILLEGCLQNFVSIAQIVCASVVIF